MTSRQAAVVTAHSRPEVLEPWIAERLHPLSAEPLANRRVQSDLDVYGVTIAPIEAALTPAAVLIALVERADGLSLILTRRADTLSRHSGQVALPGGRAEPGEAPWATALREAEEEVGLERRFVRPIGLGDPYRTGSGFEITPVLAFVAPGFTLTPSQAEVAEVFETPFAFLMDPANHEERVWEGPEGARRYYAMPHQDRLIWGATAGILRGLWERLFGEGALIPDTRPLASAGR